SRRRRPPSSARLPCAPSFYPDPPRYTRRGSRRGFKSCRYDVRLWRLQSTLLGVRFADILRSTLLGVRFADILRSTLLGVRFADVLRYPGADMWDEFKKFVARGNVIDMAVGVIMGASFGAIVKSLVDNVVMPPIGLLTGGVDFADKYIVLKAPPPGNFASVD